MVADIEVGSVAADFGLGRLGQRFAVAAVLERRQIAFQTLVQLRKLAMVEPVQFHGLLECKQVVVPPVAFECHGNRLFILFAPRVAKLGEFTGITLTVQNRIDDP